MDPITHGIVGAAAAQTASGKKEFRLASAIGFLSALAPDIDNLIYSASDPLLNIELHRQFTHSIIFIPIGALICTLFFWLFLKRKLTFKKIYIYSIAGYGSHWFMDTITSYGTVLFWPFFETRYAWNLVSVVDPIMSAGLLLFLGLSIYHKKKIWTYGLFAWLLFYLMTGWIQLDRAQTAAEELAQSRGHQIEQLVVKPTIGNQILWRSTYEFENRFYTDGIRSSYFGGVKIYEGESAEKVVPEVDYRSFAGTTLYSDLQRMAQLSDNFLIHHPEKLNIVGDARYSMLPTSMIPLWGVEADTTNPQQHLDFLYFRDAGDTVREPFMDMLLGKDL